MTTSSHCLSSLLLSLSCPPSLFFTLSISLQCTQIWPHADYPLIPVGKMVLNRNPKNYFAEVEQIVFEPSNMPPGIEPSPDKMLQVLISVYNITILNFHYLLL